jgi:hypothetical protein
MKFPKLAPIFMFFLFSACCEDDPAVPQEKVWEKFIGTYNVTKLENGDTYQMTISHLGTDTLENQAIRDSLVVYNYGDLFNQIIYYSSNISSIDDRILRFPTNWPTDDKHGHRWAFFINAQDTVTEELENTLINDTILLYFKLSNIAFYFEDGVPYYDCDCKHLAVKIE